MPAITRQDDQLVIAKVKVNLKFRVESAITG